MKTIKDKCGCRHDGQRWTVLCDEHEREEDARHITASRESGKKPRPSVVQRENNRQEDALEMEAQLGDEFFEKAALTRAGESVIDTVTAKS